jgi:hypothetical protein
MKLGRPTVITVLSLLLMLGGVVTITQMAMSSRIAFCTPEFIASASGGFGAMAWVCRRFGCDGFLFVSWAMGLTAGVIGVGLWRLAAWARLALMAICIIGLPDGTVQVVVALRKHDFIEVAVQTLSLAIAVWLIRYLHSPDVRARLV